MQFATPVPECRYEVRIGLRNNAYDTITTDDVVRWIDDGLSAPVDVLTIIRYHPEGLNVIKNPAGQDAYCTIVDIDVSSDAEHWEDHPMNTWSSLCSPLAKRWSRHGLSATKRPTTSSVNS